MALKLGIQTYQILTNDDEVCIPILSSLLLDAFNITESKNHVTDKTSTKRSYIHSYVMLSCIIKKL